MPFDTAVEMPSEVVMYNERWQRLLDHVHAGIPLHGRVRDAIDAWGKQATPEAKVETDPVKRHEQVQARVAALSKHFAEVVGTVTVWAAGLKPLMDACSASLDGLPVFASVNEVHSAFARAAKRTLPPMPPIKLDNPESLENRARWLRQVAEIMQQVEGGPREIGAALRILEAVLLRYNDELEDARGRQRTGTQGDSIVFEMAAADPSACRSATGAQACRPTQGRPRFHVPLKETNYARRSQPRSHPSRHRPAPQQPRSKGPLAPEP